MIGETRGHQLFHTLPTLILICMFSLCVLAGTLFGINSYNRVDEVAERNFVGRTGLTYVITKLRQADIVSATVDEQGGALTLREENAGQGYLTRLYVSDGTLVEAFGGAGEDADAFITEIADVDDFAVNLIADNLLEIRIEDGYGRTYSAVVYLQGRVTYE